MNNFDEKWKCPNCDTFNNGRRCIVCGHKQQISNLSPLGGGLKSTVPEKTESGNKKRIIAIVSASCIVGIAIVCWLISFLITDNETVKPKTKTEKVQNEILAEEEEKEEFFTDSVLNRRFNISKAVEDIQVDNTFVAVESGKILFVYPKLFECVAENVYKAYDETAYVVYGCDEWAGSLSELVEKRKKLYGYTMEYEEAVDSTYVISTERDGIRYYENGMIQDGKVVSFVFAYPAEYQGAYERYAEDMAEGLAFPDTSGIEVIEE